MKTIKMTVEFKYDNKVMHGNDEEDRDWFYNEILKSKRRNDLILHSNEIGDEIGEIKVLSFIKDK